MMTYNGVNIFGSAVQFQHVVHPRAQQVNAYFGVSGTQVLDGGGRGRSFYIRGVLVAPTFAELSAAEAQFATFADGVARTLVDTPGAPGRTSSTTASSCPTPADRSPPAAAGPCPTAPSSTA